MTVPPYVSLFQNGWIRVVGDLSSNQALARKLVSIPFGFRGVRFDDCDVYANNPSLTQAMLALNDLGVAFGEDCKQLCNPCEFMRDLQKDKILKKSFLSIYWRGPGDWYLQNHAPN
jgi:hypothetical protein